MVAEVMEVGGGSIERFWKQRIWKHPVEPLVKKYVKGVSTRILPRHHLSDSDSGFWPVLLDSYSGDCS